MHIHFHIHHWVIWWFYVGVVLAGMATMNILERHLKPPQDLVLLIFFGLFWLLGGLVCYALEDALSRRSPR